MQIEHRKYGETSVVKLPARLVMGVAPTVRAALTELVDAGRIRLVLDLRGIEYVDSSGLSVLISTLKIVQQHGGEIVLLDPSPGARALIELTRLHQVFDIYQNEAAAIASLN